MFKVTLPFIPVERPVQIGGCVPIVHVNMAQRTQAILNMHLKWVRLYVQWDLIQPEEKEVYHFHFYDPIIRPLVDAGVNCLITIARHPAWASATPGEKIYPTKIPAYWKFIEAIVKHYKAFGIHYWEFENEEDNTNNQTSHLGTSCYGNEPWAYVNDLSHTYTKIKSIDPTARVFMGGLAYDFTVSEGGPFQDNYLALLINWGLLNVTDGINIHHFPQYDGKWEAKYSGKVGVAAKIADVRRLAPNKPIMVSEIGKAGIPNNNVSLIEQADYVETACLLCREEKVEQMYWYAVDAQDGSNCDLVNSDFSLKPSGEMMRAINLTWPQNYVGVQSAEQ